MLIFNILRNFNPWAAILQVTLAPLTRYHTFYYALKKVPTRGEFLVVRLQKKKKKKKGKGKKKVKVLVAIYREMTEKDEPWIPLPSVLPVSSRPCLSSSCDVISTFLHLQSQGGVYDRSQGLQAVSRSRGGKRVDALTLVACALLTAAPSHPKGGEPRYKCK